jgi:hypothetical protein
MPYSRRLKQLTKRLDTIRAHLLPAHFSATGRYTDKEHDLARGYMVLAHAEIEAYFEDRCSSVVARAQQRWKKKSSCGRTLIRLMKVHNLNQKQPWRPVEKTQVRVNAAINSYMDSIKQNNGIKEDNLFKLLFPIGIEADDLSSTWLAVMNSFGGARGAVAHTSVRTQQPIDPASEYKRIAEEIIPGLRKIDKKISRC